METWSFRTLVFVFPQKQKKIKRKKNKTFVQPKREEHEAVCLAATALLDAPGSDGPSNPPQRKTRSDMLLDLRGFDTKSVS